MSDSNPEIIDPQRLATEIDRRLRSLPRRDTKSVREFRREYSKRIAKAKPRQIVELASRLLDFGSIQHRFVAYELVCRHRNTLKSLGKKELELLGRGIDSWDSVDCFACYLSGPAWREHQVPDSLIHSWARSNDRWWRRAAVVSSVPLNNKARGGRGDTARTLEICRKLRNDRDDMVVKAISWTLRELAKRDPVAVSKFVSEHRNVLAPRVLREVHNKLSTGLKNPNKTAAKSRPDKGSRN
jgi:3-methyladenine DNA glycosylase AlkD